MDKLEMAIALLQEAREEKINLKVYEKEESRLPKDYGTPEYHSAIREFFKRWERIPHKSVVNDNIKMARRLLVSEYIK